MISFSQSKSPVTFASHPLALVSSMMALFLMSCCHDPTSPSSFPDNIDFILYFTVSADIATLHIRGMATAPWKKNSLRGAATWKVLLLCASLLAPLP